MRALAWRWAREAVKDGLADCRQAGLRWWPGDSLWDGPPLFPGIGYDAGA